VRRLRNVMGGFGELLFEVREFDFDVEAGGSIV
jgi:hypothetical protein